MFCYHHINHIMLLSHCPPPPPRPLFPQKLQSSSDLCIVSLFYFSTGKLYNHFPPVLRAAKALVENVCIWRQYRILEKQTEAEWHVISISSSVQPGAPMKLVEPNLAFSRPTVLAPQNEEREKTSRWGYREQYRSSSILIWAGIRSSNSKLSQGSRFSVSQ